MKKREFTDADMTSTKDANSKPARRRSMWYRGGDNIGRVDMGLEYTDVLRNYNPGVSFAYLAPSDNLPQL